MIHLEIETASKTKVPIFGSLIEGKKSVFHMFKFLYFRDSFKLSVALGYSSYMSYHIAFWQYLPLRANKSAK